MVLMDVVEMSSLLELETKENSRQQFDAAMRCSQQLWEAAKIFMLVETVAKRFTKREQEADQDMMISQQLVADMMISWQQEVDMMDEQTSM